MAWAAGPGKSNTNADNWGGEGVEAFIQEKERATKAHHEKDT